MIRARPSTEPRSSLVAAIRSMIPDLAADGVLAQCLANCEGAIAVDREARITWIDDKYKALLDVDDKVVGKPVETVIPNSLLRRVLKTGEPILLDLMEFKGRSFVVIRLPLRNAKGEIAGAVGIVLFDHFGYLQPIISKINSLESALATAQKQLAGSRKAKYSLSQFIGHSPGIRRVRQIARRASQLDSSVLLLGETGTGKELLAHAIHAASARLDKPFVAINLAAIPESLIEAEFFGVAPGAYTGADRKGRAGKFQLADGGTLFLDEIGDMPLGIQAKLLRALQEREIEPLGSNKLVSIDVRVIAATSRDLTDLIELGAFRRDLYYRLNVLPITVPPLRERIEDLDDLCHALLERVTGTGRSQPTLSPEALALLAAHDWPGNVRELANVLERLTALSDKSVIDAEDVALVLPELIAKPPAEIPAPPAARAVPENGAQDAPLNAAVAQVERETIAAALVQANGVKSTAARILGISRAKLYDKLMAHNMLRSPSH